MATIPAVLQERIKRIYLRTPRRFIRFSREVVLPAYGSALSDITRDAPSDDLRDAIEQGLDELIASIVEEFETEFSVWTDDLDTWHAEHYRSAVEDEFDIDVGDLTPENEFDDELRADIEQNVALVRGLSSDARKELERIIFDGLVERKSSRQVAREINERIGVTRSRALLIARDQDTKISGTLDKLRQQSFGIEHYIFRHTGDFPENPNARETHHDLDGTVQRWDTDIPNGVVRPGFEINCRCLAQAHIVLEGDE